MVCATWNRLATAAPIAALSVVALVGGGSVSSAVSAGAGASATPVADDGLVISTLAGTGEAGYSGDGGPAIQAAISQPDAVAVGPDGSVYVSDGVRHIRKIATDGTITTIAGTGEAGFSGDGGPATEAAFSTGDWFWSGGGMTVGPDGTLYVADRHNHRVRAIGPDGIVRTVAGSGPSVLDRGADSPGLNGGFAGDGGPAVEALLNNPTDVALGPDGTLYIADSYNYRIRAVAPDGTISTIAGSPHAGDDGSDFFPSPDNDEDGRPATETFVEPDALAVADDGTVYFVERDENRVRIIDPATRIVATLGGTDGLAAQHVTDIAVVGDTIYVSRFSEDGAAGDGVEVISTAPDGSARVFGGGAELGDGGAPSEAAISHPLGVAAGPDGAVYIADSWANRVRVVVPATAEERPDDAPDPGADPGQDHDIATVAGSGEVIPDDAGDRDDDGGWLSGGATLLEARLDTPRGVAFGPDSTLYIADTGNHRVRAIEPGSDRVRTVAGTGSPSDEGDGGPATEADLNAPSGLDVHDGVLYIADKWNNRIRSVDLESGTIDTVPGTATTLAMPLDVAVDDDGVLYVADSDHNRVCRVGPEDQQCTTVVGDFDDDAAQAEADQQDGGSAGNAALMSPMGVAVGPDGTLYIADTGTARIRAYDPATGEVTIVAGNGTLGVSGDGGPALAAQLGVPVAVEVAADGTVYVSDVGNHRIRAIDPETGVIRTVAGTGRGDFSTSDGSTIALGFAAGEPVGGAWTEAGGYAGDGGPAQDAELNWPQGIAVADDGVLYVADSGNNRVRAIGDADLDARGSISPRVWVVGGGAVVLAAAAIVVVRLRLRRRAQPNSVSPQ